MYRKVLSICLALWVLSTSVGIAKISVKCLTQYAPMQGCCDSSDDGANSCCSDNPTDEQGCCIVQVEVLQADYNKCVFKETTCHLDAASVTYNNVIHPPIDHLKSSLKTKLFENPPWIYHESLHLEYASLLI